MRQNRLQPVLDPRLLAREMSGKMLIDGGMVPSISGRTFPIVNPATQETIIGGVDCGILYNGKPAKPSQRTDLKGATILASRSEVKRGEWQPFLTSDYNIRPMGSVAYNLALVAAGRADITFTLTPKNE